MREEPKEQFTFELQPSIEDRHFDWEPAQKFFKEWCRINDSIVPEFLTRETWEQRGIKGILEKRPDGKQTLYIPSDLQLWEMVEIMEVVDRDTFARKPEKQSAKVEKLVELGKTLQEAGVYIAQRLDSIDEGRGIAESLAEEFFNYGNSLASGEQSMTEITIEEMKVLPLLPDDLQKVDRWLGGDSLYESRRARVERDSGMNPAEREAYVEKERQRTLRQFFLAAQRAFELTALSKKSILNKPRPQLTRSWDSQTSFHEAFLLKVKNRMIADIETPKTELYEAIFRRGLEKLLTEMPELGWRHAANTFFAERGINIEIKQRSLEQALNMPNLKAELEQVRKIGDKTQIARKEREIASKIQKAVSSFPLNDGANNPSELVQNQFMNCVGASILGGALLSEAGIRYLLGDVPQHSVLFIVASDGQVTLADMSVKDFAGNEALVDEVIQERNKDDSSLTIADVIAFSERPNPRGLRFDIARGSRWERLPWVTKDQRYVTLYAPEYGQKVQLLNNTGAMLMELNLPEQALEAYRQAVALDPLDAYPWRGMGSVLSQLGGYVNAAKAFRKAISIDPNFFDPYPDLGFVLLNLREYPEALNVFYRAFTLRPDDKGTNYGLGHTLRELGRKQEAIAHYAKFIKLADPEKDKEYIDKARTFIIELAK